MHSLALFWKKRRLLEFWRGILKRRRCARSERATKGIGAYFESLESRVLLSGGVEGALVDADLSGNQDFAQAPVAAEIAFVEQAQETALLDLSGLAESDPEVQPDLMDGAGMREIVFVDENVSDYERLIAGLQQADDHRNIEVAVLESDQNGIGQVSEILNERSNLSAVHFITHGAAGQINLGNTWLNSATLEQYSAMVSGWGNALSETADILFYGCNIAAASDGQSLLNTIADLTGADVAASDDLTGNAQSGGDWNLEFVSGEIETHVVLSREAQQEWSGVLATFTVNTTGDTVDANPGDGNALDSGGNTSLRAAIMEANALAGADTVSLPAGTYTLSRAGANEDAASTGDLDITGDLTVNGAGANATYVDGGALDRVFHIRNGSTVSIQGVTIRNGSAPDYGGGLYVSGANQVTLTGVVAAGNAATSGGAIYNYQSSLTVVDSAIEGNTVSEWGGGLYNDRGTVSFGRVTVAGNSAGKDGGGLYNFGVGSSMTLTNVTVSGNTALGAGGALYTNRVVAATNVTVAFNSAGAGSGGIHKQNPGTTSLKNCILANNTGGNANGALTSLGNNIDDDGTAGLTGEGDLSINALLDPTLRDNGGPTLTHALLLGSPAINAGTNTGAPPVDQRGFPRSDGSTDIGAYESYESGTAPAPGGVTSQLKLWLKADAGVTQSGTVSRWDNQVANATLPFVQQATASDRPQYSPSAVNFHPAITFDGVNDDLRDDSVLGSDLFVSDAASIFTVVRTTSNVIIQWLDTLSNRVSLEGGAPRFDFGDLVADRLDGIGTSPGYHIVNAQAAPGTPANLAIYVNGSLNNSKSASSGNPLDPTPTGLLRLGEYPGGGYNAAMDLAEVVIYQSNLSAADRLKVESYLAVKYGLTLNQAAPTSYVASDGTVIWDAALNAGYNNDIAGIGRDDASSLAQTQSRSINSDAIVTLSSASDQNNDEFLLWGNNNGALTETAVGNPAGVLQRLQRIWRVDETGDVGTTTMKLDVNGLPVTGTTVGDFKLIVDSDTDFTSGATLLSASSYVGGIVTFNGVNLADGAYFALATDFCQPPVLATIEGVPLTYTENDPATAVTATITAGDQDDANLAGATIQITGNYVSGQDVLSFTNTASITGAWNAVTGKLTLSGTDTVANYQAALRAVKYQNTSEDPSAGTRNVGFQVNDGTADSNLLTRDITVTPVNDPPVDTIPGAQNTAMNTAVVFSAANGNLISTGDIDAGTNPLEVTLTAADGTLTLNGTSGLNFSLGDGSADPTMTFTGTAADINTALDGLRYDPPPGYSGSTTLAITTNDQGYVGAGGPQSDVSAVIINVAFTNTAPTLSGANDLATIDEDPVANPGTLVSDLITGMVSDPDAGAIFGIAVTAVDNTNGVWQYTTDGGGAWVDFGSPSETAARLLAGDASTLVRFVPDPNWNGTVTSGITFRAWDRTSGAAGDTADVTTTGGTTAFSVMAASANVTVNPVNDAPVGVPTITGTVTEDQVLTADTSGISDTDGLGAFSYQWRRDGVDIAGATNPTYTLTDADVGTQISVQVSYADGHGTNESLTSAQTAAVANVNDAPVGVPTITGTVTEDQTLSADTSGISDADGLGAFSYQWLRNGANIVGATSNTYTLGDADVGTQISVQVSYTDGHGTNESLTSAQTPAVANVNDAPVGVPTITGTVTEDHILTADTTGISDADGLGAFSYQWLRNGANIAGAAGSTYTLGDADVGTQISLQVGYTDGQGTSESLTSAQTAAVANVNDAPVGVPTITGTVTEDQLLTADTTGISDADGLGVFSYQWLRNGANIPGATASNYTLGDADVGTQISVQVNYTDGHGTAESVTSAQTAAVANVNDAPVGVPTITGTVTEDNILTADTTGISDADGLGAFSYQWLRDGVVIGGATASTYTLGDADVGTQISVQVSYTDGHGTAESVTSAQTAAVANVNDAPVGLPTITGTVTEDQTLTANTAGISDADGLGAFSYQWLRNGANISGATSSAYTLGDADVGAQISVAVGYTDGHGTAESLSSAQTAAVANVNDAPAGLPTIAGTVTEDQTLTADTSGISDADGLGAFSYQWLRNGAGISGATASTYTLGDADVGTQIRVQVSYTDGHGTNEGVTSAQTAAVANVNDAPVANDDSSSTNEDTAVTLNVVANDSDLDGDTLTVSAVSQGTNGTVTFAGGSVTYTPNANFNGSDSFTYSVSDGNGGSGTATVNVTVNPVNDTPVGVPTITGTSTEDQTLTADTSTVADADGLGAFSYQWQRSTDGGSTWASMGGATGSSYILGDADVGNVLRVIVSYTDGQGTSEGVTSAATAAIVNVNDAPTGAVTITGTPTEDQVLTADTSGISDADGLGAFSYQWLRNGANIVGATGATYTLGASDIGAQISMRVSYTDGHGTNEIVTSATVGPVTHVSDLDTVVIDDRRVEPPVNDVINPGTVDIDNPTDVVEPNTVPPDNQSSPLPEHTDPSPNSAGGGSVPNEAPEEAAPEAGVPGDSNPTSTQPPQKGDVPSAPSIKKDLPSFLIPKDSLLKTEAGRSDQSTAIQKQDLRPERPFSVMRASDYEHLRDSLDAVKEEMTSETRLGKVYLGSAIVSSIGLSVGYVVWLLRGGMLLASLLSSVPAWQFLDPLPILARKKDDDNSDDNESLESIVDKKPEQINPKKRTADAAADAEVKGP